MNVQGKVALVTGGGRRLGRAFVLALADAGMNVVVHYGHSTRDAEETVTLARQKGAKAVALQADLQRAEEVEAVLPQAMEIMGQPVQVLVNSAAIFKPGTVKDTPLENWTEHFRINLRAPFLLMQSFARLLGDRPGKVVNITDWRATHPGQKYVAYTLSKAALNTLTVIAAREFAPNVQVNALALGAVLPPPDRDDAYLQRLVQRIPARRSARIEEVTEALLFLLDNDYITGEMLFVDGGAHLLHG